LKDIFTIRPDKNAVRRVEWQNGMDCGNLTSVNDKQQKSNDRETVIKRGGGTGDAIQRTVSSAAAVL